MMNLVWKLELIYAYEKAINMAAVRVTVKD